MPTDTNSLQIAKTYVAAVEAKDRTAVADTLAEDAQHIFPLSIGGSEGLLAVFEGKTEILAYIDALFGKFASLSWPNPDWTLSDDGQRVFLQAKGDMVTAQSKAAYRNTYVVRFDFADGRIQHVTEYANPELYMALGIEPSEIEMIAVERAASMNG